MTVTAFLIGKDFGKMMGVRAVMRFFSSSASQRKAGSLASELHFKPIRSHAVAPQVSIFLGLDGIGAW